MVHVSVSRSFGPLWYTEVSDHGVHGGFLLLLLVRRALSAAAVLGGFGLVLLFRAWCCKAQGLHEDHEHATESSAEAETHAGSLEG
jgi:hypothetical protein